MVLFVFIYIYIIDQQWLKINQNGGKYERRKETET